MRHENGGGGGFIMLHCLPTEEGKYHKVRQLLGAFDIERKWELKVITCNLLNYASYVAGETKPSSQEGIASKQ